MVTWVEAVCATAPRSNGNVQNGHPVDHIAQEQRRTNEPVEDALVVETSMAGSDTGIEDVTQTCETTRGESKTKKSASEDVQDTLGMPQVNEFGNCDAWITPELLKHCDSLTFWYSSPKGNDCSHVTAFGQEMDRQSTANRSLSNWYTESVGADVAPPSPSNKPILGQAPCHYYRLSSFVDEFAASNCDEVLGTFCLDK